MVLGGTNFLIHYRVFKGDGRALFDNTEMRYWWSLIGGFSLLILAERIFRGNIIPSGIRSLEENFRAVIFQVTAILTTTGFSTRDIGSPFFGTAARQLFLLMMVIGGCVGSTGGGLKVLRVAILTRTARREIFRLRAPRRSISSVVIDGKIINIDEIRRVGALFFAWVALLTAGGVITAFFSSLNGYQAFSGIFSALGNIGPSYIPAARIGGLHPVIKLTYITGMLAGRLEIIPVLLLFSPRSWR
jgi:trk system potassium uptake protein TrkH